MEEKPLPDKAAVIRLLLEREGRVMVCLDATQKEVDVPRRFCTDPGLILVFNSTMPQPIHILPDSIASELRFGGIPHYCVIPYTAIWSAFNPDSNHGVVWPESMPESVRHTHGVMQLPLEEIEPDEAFAAEALPTSPSPVQEKRGAPFLQVIDGDGEEDSPAEAAPATSRARRPHLRLVE
ncbi:MAG: ClpXP protease specificity-enhancing factor SspB [Magnetococcus sp. YQC-3]